MSPQGFAAPVDTFFFLQATLQGAAGGAGNKCRSISVEEIHQAHLCMI